ncbi:MAG: hypothetical protein CL897_01100 [Dehalococcoidia bacterium]|nr:hypothetical protein [Dehalococcoidia bacterium]HCV00723.1 hypothetical protein [Dehalococcoidia bacterium]|tara:strand:- start:5161 stop:5367 length:207 start_codon:yes stop_codon:yes gene_type:complete
MSDVIETSASFLYTAVLSAADASSLDKAADEWLNDHIQNKIVSMQLASENEILHLLIVYKGERRVRRA